MVLLCQMRRQESDCAEMDAAIGEECQDRREPACGTCGFDPVVRAVLGEVQDLGAIREHRGAALLEIEAPRIELRERGDQARSGLRFRSGEPLHLDDQLFVGEVIMNEERFSHDPCIALRFLTHVDSRGGEISPQFEFVTVSRVFAALIEA